MVPGPTSDLFSRDCEGLDPVVPCDVRDAEPVTAGVLRLLDPPAAVYRGVLRANVTTHWQSRVAMELAPAATLIAGYRSCQALERALRLARASVEAALCARLAGTAWRPPCLLTAVHHATEKEALCTVLEALQRGVRAADFPWHVLAAVEHELAPRQAEIEAFDTRVRRPLCEAFGFLDFSRFSLQALHCGTRGHVIDVAYVPHGESAPATPTIWCRRFPTLQDWT